MIKWIWNEELGCYCAGHNNTIRADKNGNVFGGGGGKTTVVQPQPAPQPSTADAIKAWVEALPKVYETELQYAPLQAQLAVQLAQQYALPYAEAYKTAQEALYPGTTALQEQLAEQAQAGIQAELPEWAKRTYLDTMRAQLGENALSGIGADYISRGLMQQQEDWRRYYQNLGLSLTGRQPLIQATTPQVAQYSQQFQPQDVMNYMLGGYSAYTQAARPLTVTRGESPLWGMLGQGVGGLMGGIGTAIALSSKRYKKNIRKWVKH
jgi:hypothetical protein